VSVKFLRIALEDYNQGFHSGPVRPLGKLGSRLGPPIFRGRQFCIINIKTSKKSFKEIYK